MDRKNLWHLLYWIGALLAVLGIQTWLATSQVQLVGFDQFEQALRDDRLQQVVVTDTHLSGQLKTPEQGKRELVTVRIEPELLRQLEGVCYDSDSLTLWLTSEHLPTPLLRVKR